MFRHFGGLLNQVATAIATTLEQSATYEHILAVPGFHIFDTAAIPRAPTASVHFDLQYQQIDWALQGGADPASAISFTLPILLPKGGAGLNFWDVTLGEMRYLQNYGFVRSVGDVVRLRERKRLPYRLGTLVMHSGHLLHQIGETSEVAARDQRITLQGHGMLSGGRIKLYW
jgi:hypothetical protein